MKFIFKPDSIPASKVFLDGLLSNTLYKQIYNTSCEIVSSTGDPNYIMVQFDKVNLIKIVHKDCLHTKSRKTDMIDKTKSELYHYADISTYIIDNRKENTMSLVELYKERKIKELNDAYSNKVEELKNEDPRGEAMSQFMTMKEVFLEEFRKTNPSADISIMFHNIDYSSETQDKLDTLKSKLEEEKSKITYLVEEVNARLELCENEVSKMKVLSSYGLIDKNGHLKI